MYFGEHHISDRRQTYSWTLRLALQAFVSSPLLPIVSAFVAIPGWGHEPNLRPVRQLLWSDVVAKALIGDLIVSGIPLRSSRSEDIDARLLQTSEPDFTHNFLKTFAGLFTHVEVRPATTLSAVWPTSPHAILVLPLLHDSQPVNTGLHEDDDRGEVGKPVTTIRSTPATRPIDVRLGVRIAARRRELGLSEAELGAKLGDDGPANVEQNERGALQVTAARLILLSAALDVPLSFFFNDL